MSDPTEKPDRPRGKPFQKGVSGNPAGKAPGTRNKSTLFVEALFDGEAEEIIRKTIELAKGGDIQALRMCVERIAPPRRDRHVSFKLPALDTVADAKVANAALVQAVADSELTPAEANDLAKLIETFVKTIEATEFEERLSRLEGLRQ